MLKKTWFSDLGKFPKQHICMNFSIFKHLHMKCRKFSSCNQKMEIPVSLTSLTV